MLETFRPKVYQNRSLRGNSHNEGRSRIPSRHGIEHILFQAWNKICWIPFEKNPSTMLGVRVTRDQPSLCLLPRNDPY
ncbi:hypothetical protein TNCV_4409641 [Trichonephila clavipes]|nr:hypothetical protein TNCV_4409641 [Trichonephila clavipes]